MFTAQFYAVLFRIYPISCWTEGAYFFVNGDNG